MHVHAHGRTESGAAATVRINAFDDAGRCFGPATLTVPAGRTQHFNSQDLEGGNPDKGLAAGVGTGGGDWRLELTTDADIRVLAYVRHRDGLVAAMHNTVRGTVDDAGGYLYEVPMFGPESYRHQTSLLRAINDGRRATDLTITAVDDDDGVASTAATTVQLTLAAGKSRVLSAAQLESGDGLTGALGDGNGQWRLQVRADRPVAIMNLLLGAGGQHIANLSDADRQYEK